MAGIDPDALGFLLNDISRLIRAAMDRANSQSGIGVTPAQARILAFAARSGAVRQSRLAEQIGVEAMTLSGHLDGLEARGLIERQPDPADRRAKIVTVLADAEPVLEAIAVTGAQIRATASIGFDEAEWASLKDALKRIRANLAAEASEASDAA